MNRFDDLSFAGLARSVAPTFSGGYSLASPGRMVAVTWPLRNSVWGPHVMGVPNAGASAGNRQQPAGRRWGRRSAYPRPRWKPSGPLREEVWGDV